MTTTGTDLLAGLRSRLSLVCYSPPSSSHPLILADYAERIEALSFTTVAPGGFGDLVCALRVPDLRQPRPELAIFAQCALRDGLETRFAGYWSDPALVLDPSDGEHLILSALGGGVALRDDPDDSSYNNQTPQSIVASEVSKRSAYLALDNDLSQVWPTNPAATFSPIYDGATLEEIMHDLSWALGDYTWAVWDHPRHRDSVGLPTAQLVAHARDTSTTHYLALPQDLAGYRVTPSEQRAYNVVQVTYVDATLGPGKVTVSDARLAANGSQGTAPFRRRKLRRNLGARPLTQAQATAIAQSWLAAYSNVSNRVEITLRGVRDAGGRPIPLHKVRADHNILVPALAIRGTQLATGPQPAVNQFYVVETRYAETGAGDVTLTLQCDNFADSADQEIARLKLATGAAARAQGIYRPVASSGAGAYGKATLQLPATAAGQQLGIFIPFPQWLPATPASITLSATTTSNVTSATYGDLSPFGFTLYVTATASGMVTWKGTYQTQGA